MADFLNKFLFINHERLNEMQRQSIAARRFFNAKMKFITISLFLTSVNAHANWYVVDNYEGKIGSTNVHVSLQKYEYFGSNNIRGSYYYDRYSAPIPLYGQRTSSTMKLCEVHSNWEYELDVSLENEDKMHPCPFTLTEIDDVLKGIWQNKSSTHKVLLKHSNSLNGESNQIERREGIEIPYWGQTPTHSFIGIYQKNENGIYIDKINTINKATGKIDQTINPQSKTCDFGFYMTSIYQNIESKKNPPQVRLNCYSTKSDISNNYKFDRKSNKYLLIKNK